MLPLQPLVYNSSLIANVPDLAVSDFNSVRKTNLKFIRDSTMNNG